MSRADTKRRKTATEAFEELPLQIRQATHAALDKKAADLTVLDLRNLSSFTDYFVLCSGQNARQVKAIADAVEETLLKTRTRPAHIEGYDRAEWVLLDYFDFIVHVFTPATREFYALDRLWGSAEKIAVPGPTRPRAAP